MNISICQFITELNNRTASVVAVFSEYSVAFPDACTRARINAPDLYITCGDSLLTLPLSALRVIERTECINGHIEYELMTSTTDAVVVDVL